MKLIKRNPFDPTEPHYADCEYCRSEFLVNFDELWRVHSRAVSIHNGVAAPEPRGVVWRCLECGSVNQARWVRDPTLLSGLPTVEPDVVLIVGEEG